MNREIKAMLGINLGVLMVISLSIFFQVSSAVAKTAPNPSEEITNALAYLHLNQEADGGTLGFSGVSDPDTTARAVLAFSLAGEPVTGVITATGFSLVDYLATQAISFTHDTTGTLFPGRAGLLLSAVVLAGGEPADFGGMDLVGELETTFQPDSGAYSTDATQGFSSGQASDLNQAWVLLGMGLAGQAVPDAASHYLVASQAEDGSWGFGDPDTTALAVTALLSSAQATPGDPVILNALEYFHATQLPNGGWKPSWDTDPLNADSTGWILQALYSAGEDPGSADWTMESNPIDALAGLQKPDGSIGGTYANTYSTAEAVIGLSGISLTNLLTPAVTSQAGLAIFPGDGTVITACVSFPEQSLTGLELLQRSAASLETATNPTQGTAVCKIGDVGCLPGDCFCSMPTYWSFWQLSGDVWEYAVLGAEQSQVFNGAVNAWSWASGDPPSMITYQNICEGVAFEMPLPTQTSLPPTDTPFPTQEPTSSPEPSATQPTPTVVSSETSLGTYVVYASIVLVLGALIVYLFRSRKK